MHGKKIRSDISNLIVTLTSIVLEERDMDKKTLVFSRPLSFAARPLIAKTLCGLLLRGDTHYFVQIHHF